MQGVTMLSQMIKNEEKIVIGQPFSKHFDIRLNYPKIEAIASKTS